ncbi:MAG TPA: zinc-binding dehydrogenase [Vicinamibacterales bacterium]
MTNTAVPAQRHVVRALRAGGPEVLAIEVDDLRPLKAGEALVRVDAAGLNHVDSLVRSGTYAIRFEFPFDLGGEGAGTVVAVGLDVALRPGTRVCWTAVLGSCATYVTAPVHMLAEVPASLSVEAGAALAHAAVTAAGLIRHCPIAKGHTAVVWGAAGAVGRLLVALLAARGVSVVGIASGERTKAARAAGAAHVVDRSSADVIEDVRRHLGGHGAAAVFDPVGAATYETNLRLLGPRGSLVNYGQLSGALPAIDLNQLMDAGSIFVTKYGHRAGVVRAEDVGPFISEALALAATRPLVSDIAVRLPLDRVADAYRALDAGAPGKVLVLPHEA